jgi:hypothetical protein
MREISNQFYSQFREKIEHWNGNINQFDSFSESLEIITKRKPTHIKILQLYDIKDAFKTMIGKRIEYYKKQRKKLESTVKKYLANINQKIKNKQIEDKKKL